jgi:hypothetical protein
MNRPTTNIYRSLQWENLNAGVSDNLWNHFYDPAFATIQTGYDKWFKGTPTPSNFHARDYRTEILHWKALLHMIVYVEEDGKVTVE